MGAIRLTTPALAPRGERPRELEATVDTGSTYTAMPREILERLGVPVWQSVPPETADGRIVPVDVGNTVIRLGGQEFPTPVIFAGEGEPSLLGVMALEHARLGVDPVAKRLVPVNLMRY